MTKEDDIVFPESLLKPTPSLADVLQYFGNLTEKKRWSIIRAEFERAADCIRQGKPVLFFMAENTKAGGPHAVRALYDPQNKIAHVEPPQETLQKGVRFPTICHTLEAIAATTGLAFNHDDNFDPGGQTVYPEKKLPYPELNFVPVLGELPDNPEIIIIPLTVTSTTNDNFIIFHTQEGSYFKSYAYTY